MVCTFFGYVDAPDWTKEALKNEIVKLIQEEGVKKFCVGNNGNFDFYVQRALKEIQNIYEEVDYFIALSYVNEKVISGAQEKSVFWSDLALTTPKFAIAKRNELLIKKSDYAICYVKYDFQRSYKWMKKAEKKGLKIINIANVK